MADAVELGAKRLNCWEGLAGKYGLFGFKIKNRIATKREDIVYMSI